MSIVDRITPSISQDRSYRPRTGFKKHAAVLIGIIPTPTGEHVIFNRRASSMNKHASEICLPGGMLEQVDGESPVNAALREAEEEIGLPHANVRVIGLLESCITSQQLEVAPVVAEIKRPTKWLLQPHEVEDIIELPLDIFLDARNYKTITRRYRGKNISSISITCKNYEIWGLTAKIMMRLQKTICQPSKS